MASIARPGPLASHLLAIFALAGVVRGVLTEPAFAQEDLGTWDTLAPMLTPRRLMAAAVDEEGKAIYTFGGCGSPCFDPPVHTSTFEETRLEVFENGSWSVRKPIPAILFGAAAATVEKKIYLFGGYVTGGDTYEYDPDPERDTWRRRAPMPTPRHGLAAVAVDGKVYVLGGSNGSAATGALEVYDPAHDSWSQKAPMPTPRVFLAAVALNKKIYAIGGSPDGNGDGNGNASGRTDAVEVYDTVTESWSRAAWLPVALQVSAAAALNGKIYVFGGFIPGSGVQGSTFEYNPEATANPWTPLKPMLEPRDQAPAVVLNRVAHVLGGSVDCHCKARDTHDFYTPPKVPPFIDVGVEKTSDPSGEVCPGAVVTYTITVTNLGTAKVDGVTVTDMMDTGHLLGVRWCRGDDCTPSMEGDLSDTLSLGVDKSETYRVRGTVSSTARGTLSNTAMVKAPGDQNPGNDKSPATLRIVPCPISITKTADRTSVAPGDSLRYTITVRSSFPTPIQATVTDDLEATGLTGFRWCRGSGCNPSKPRNLSDTVSLPANGTVTYEVAGTVPCACGKSQIENEACVTVTGQPEVCDPTTVPILPAPGGDLALTVTGADDLEDCGPLPYTFTVTNKGPGIACGAVLQAQSPAGSALVSISSPCTGLPCNLGNIAPGQQIQVTAAFSIPAEARCAVPLTTTASVNACDSAGSKAETTLPCVLYVTKSDGHDTASPGDAILYTIGITNQSCAAVSGAKVMDAFPAGLQNVQWCRGEGCPPQPHPVPLVDSLDLPFGAQETYRAQGNVSPAFTGTLSNTVTVTPPGSPPVSATDKTEIVAVPGGLTASCEALSGTPSEGGMITKTFLISNDGPEVQGDNPGPEFEDVLPAGLTLISAVASSGTVTTGANAVSWDGSLPPGGTVTVQITASIDAGTAGMKICNGGTTHFDADGDGVNERSRPVLAPCCFRVLPPGEAPPIPSLSGPGMAALALLLSLLALLRLRRRSRTG